MRILLVLAMVACGGGSTSDLCHRLAAWDANAHKGSCQLPFLTNSDTEQHCEAGLSACSDVDLAGMTSYADCRDSLPVCVAGQEEMYEGMLLACQLITDKRVNAHCVL